MEIINFPNYLIYDDGRVWSKYNNIFLKPKTNRGGYKMVNLYNNGENKSYRVNRLVAIHYIANPDNKPFVDHISGDKLDNNINNLRWMTNIENCNAHQKIRSDNTSNHKNISYYKRHNNWQFTKIVFGQQYRKYFKTKNDALWYKFMFLLLH